MAVIQGTFTVNGIPRNGATAKLWAAGRFATAPAKGTDIPSGSPTASGLTAATHGHDGAYRFEGVSVGEYYVSFEWNGSTFYDYHARNTDPRINVKTSFGAAGDGATDDTSAIQAAINAAGVSGATVYFPPGTYIIAPTGTTNYLACSGSLVIEGDGQQTVIKVKDSNPTYERIFGAAPASGSAVNDIRFRNFILDQNTSNVTGSVSDAAGSRQIAISFYNGDNIVVEGVTFKNMAGINTIIANGTTVKRVRVTNNVFQFVPKNGVASYDNTAVYINAQEAVVTNNMFSGSPSGNPRGAIQVSNGIAVVGNNISIGYRKLADIVSVTSPGRPSSDISVVGNTASRCNNGIQLWAVSNSVLSNVNIANNSIQLSQVDHGLDQHSGISFINNASITGDVRNVAVVGNVITFQAEATAGRAVDESECAGLLLHPRGTMENILVTNNIVSGAPVRGIKFGQTSGPITARGALIAHNQLIGCGTNPLAGASFRAGLALESDLHDVKVFRNLITDVSGTFGGYQSIWADSSASSTYTRVEIKDNFISVRATEGGYRFNVPTNKGIDFGEGMEGRAPIPLTDHVRYRFVASWPPSTGSYDAGDYVYVRHAVNSSGSMQMFRVVSGGTFGTLATTSGTFASGATSGTVTDTSGVAVGDYVTIAGVTGIKRIIWVGADNVIQFSSATDAAVTDAAMSFFTALYEQALPHESIKAAAPTAGTWQVGDRVWDSSPTSGQQMGWICTASGAPGTWVAMPNLA